MGAPTPQPPPTAPHKPAPPLPAPDDPAFAAFADLATRGNLVPVYDRLLTDALTPVLAYRCLVAPDDRDAPSFLFESVVGGDAAGRYSFVGARPALELVATRGEVATVDNVRGTRTVSAEEASFILTGRRIPWAEVMGGDPGAPPSPVALISADGHLLALAEQHDAQAKYCAVFAE